MSRPVGAGEHVYRVLLHAYPRRFREEYGNELELAFRDARRDARQHKLRFWIETVSDLARSAPALRAEEMLTRKDGRTRTEGGVMRPMGALAVMIGAIQLVNAGIEMSAASAKGSAVWLGSVVLGMLLGVLLMATGIALLRRTPAASRWARVSAVACLALMLLIQLIGPWMSIFGIILGVGFPLALLVYSWMDGDSRGSTPRTA
jgi:hypothetical protein